jgi:hypothetical protein
MTNFLTTLLDVITNNGTTEGWYWCSIREDKDIQLQGTYIYIRRGPSLKHICQQSKYILSKGLFCLQDNRVTDHRLKMNFELTSFLLGDIEAAVQVHCINSFEKIF